MTEPDTCQPRLTCCGTDTEEGWTGHFRRKRTASQVNRAPCCCTAPSYTQGWPLILDNETVCGNVFATAKANLGEQTTKGMTGAQDAKSN